MGYLYRETKGNTTGKGGPKNHPNSGIIIVKICGICRIWSQRLLGYGPRDNVRRKKKMGILWFLGLPLNLPAMVSRIQLKNW